MLFHFHYGLSGNSFSMYQLKGKVLYIDFMVYKLADREQGLLLLKRSGFNFSLVCAYLDLPVLIQFLIPKRQRQKNLVMWHCYAG